jgi:transglutaminase-like putative cysteine protease
MGASRTVELHYRVEIPEPKDHEDPVQVWLPLPASTPQQEVIGVEIDASLPMTVHFDPTFGNSILHGVTPGDGGPAHAGYRATVVRHEWCVDLKTPIRPMAQDDQWLRSQLGQTRRVRFLPDVIAAAQSIHERHGNALEVARAAYEHVLSTMRYDKAGEGWGEGDTAWACSAGRGNCTDFHTLFMALLRCCGLACEFEIGAAFPSGVAEGDITGFKCGYHCWTRFYVPGLGWVPADVSEAALNPDKREYFFGAIDEHRVMLSRGRDVEMVPSSSLGPENFFTEPRLEKRSGRAVVYEKRLEFRSL